MTKQDFLNLIEQGITQVAYKNPTGRGASIEVRKDNIDNLLQMQEDGWTFTNPLNE